MPPVDPIRNVQATPSATNPAGQDPLAARNDRRGGGGAGGGGKKEAEAEPEAQAPEDEGPHLEGDALAMRGHGPLGANLDFGDELPWEHNAAAAIGPPKPRGLGKPQATPPGLGRKAPPPPLGRTGPLPPPTPAARPVVAPQMGAGRRVEVSYDPTAALTQTFSALQGMGELHAGDAPAQPEVQAPQAPAGGLMDPLAALRGRAGQPEATRRQPPAPSLEALPEGAEAEAGLEAGPDAAGSPAAPDLGFDFKPEDLTLPTRPPSPKAALARANEAPKLDRGGPGALAPRPGNAPPPTRANAPRPQQPGTRPLAPRAAAASGDASAAQASPAAPGPLGAPLPPAAPAAQAPSIGPTAVPPPAAQPAAVQAPAPVAKAAPAPPPAVEPARRPAALDAPPPAPTPPKDAAALMVRVVDLRSNDPLGGARLELEPVENERLPTLPGQADAQGWWVVPRISPGLYRLTVRHPGKVPTSRELGLVAGELEDVGLVMASP